MLAWVSVGLLKVSVVETIRLSRSFVCADSVSKRRRWSLCWLQSAGVLVWSGCRCCWRRSMMWIQFLLRLDDRCPGLCNPWLTGCVSMWPQSVDASPRGMVARGLGVVHASGVGTTAGLSWN